LFKPQDTCIPGVNGQQVPDGTKKILLLLLYPFNSLFSRTTWVSQYQKDKTSLDLNEARDDRVLGYNGIS